MYVLHHDVYKCGEYNYTETIAFDSKKQAKRYGEKHFDNYKVEKLSALQKRFPDGKFYIYYIKYVKHQKTVCTMLPINGA